ncbi:MAG: hypothetical protein QOJ99_4840 [Bryobacterales bacterium]|jgi:hypothetical protein|nr:hypothetical protein [Bryobacterales bacterium]
MKITKSSIALTAAFAGLLSGTASRVSAAPSSSDGSAKIGVAGQLADSVEAKKEKHGCKGMNSCKGKGGCKSGDNGCKGKNSCKGKGGCATDGSMK